MTAIDDENAYTQIPGNGRKTDLNRDSARARSKQRAMNTQLFRANREDINKQLIKLIAASEQPHAGSKAPSPGERRLAAIRVAPGVRRMRSLLAPERDRSAVSGERGSRFREHTDCNGVEIFPDCFDCHVRKLPKKCKFHSCGHDCIFVPLDEQGSLLAMDQNTAHASKNPKTGTCVAASFFFALGTNEREVAKGRRRQLKLFEQGRFNDLTLCDRVARRVLSGWDRDLARFKPRAKYQNEDLTLTRKWTEEKDMKKLAKEFPDLHELQLQAERKFFDMYGTNVTAHSIWFNLKTPCAGGFDKHVDEFSTEKGHIGTITVNLLQLENCLPKHTTL